jgi:hypothetical protein
MLFFQFYPIEVMMASLKVGDEISIPIDPLGLFKHRGICVDVDPFTGEPVIAHNSRKHRGVRNERLSEFSGGKRPSVRVRQTILSPVEIQSRCRERSDKPYNLISNNCEDFVSEVLSLNEGSPQRVVWGLVISASLLYMMTKTRLA